MERQSTSSDRRRQIESVYRAALSLPPAERAAFIAGLRGTNDELKRGVEALLAGSGTEVREARAPDTGLAPGTLLGSYRIDARLGEGGMGVVYRATDTKLDRPVAIKFLADNLFDANARRRFQREAQMASSLNHPHILAVYDIGEHDDRQYLVTELVDGGTLQDWADAEPHRWRQIVELLVGVADGLAAAHAANILHRDIKPANILLTTNGYAKLADFGLAKLVEDPAAPSRVRTRQTATGAIVGTAAYMSPEQALGRPLDARSDIFSFGVLLYELLAGRHPFAGETDVVMLQAVIHTAPEPLPDSIPEALKTVVEKSIEKEPAERYQSMRELVVDLRRIARKSSADRLPAAQAKPQPRWRAWLPWGAAGAALMALIAIIAATVTREEATAPTEPTQFVILPPKDTTFAPGSGTLALSPDGRQIVFTATNATQVAQLWLRTLGSLDARPLQGTDGASYPFWSPDGRSLGFYARGKLLRIQVSGGPPQELADAAQPGGATWTRDGTIIFAASNRLLQRIPATGGPPAIAAQLDAGVINLPSVLPDDRHFLSVTGLPGQVDTVMRSFDSSEVTLLLAGVVGAIYAWPGYLLFSRDGVLNAQRFDADRLALSGEPVQLAARVGGVSFAAADNGTLAYRQNPGPPQTRLVWADRGGLRTEIPGQTANTRDIALSDDGRRLATARPKGTTLPDLDLWITDLQRGASQRLTLDDRQSAAGAVWSPDGSTVAFTAFQDGRFNIHRQPSNFSGRQEVLLTLDADHTVSPSDWSPDGRYLTYQETHAATQLDTWVVALDADGNPEGEPSPLLNGAYNESQAQFSPDGKWLAYVSDESGRLQVYVQSFPALGQRLQVSTEGGTQPRWARDGTELFFLALDQKLMATSVTAGETFEIGATHVLFETALPFIYQRQTYDVAPDGRLLLNETLPAEGLPITVVLNWPALLPR